MDERVCKDPTKIQTKERMSLLCCFCRHMQIVGKQVKTVSKDWWQVEQLVVVIKL